jgi:nucleoside-diphosphate-sugar epimerase
VEAKKFGETLVDNYRQQYDLDAKIVRVFNTYGPRVALNDGRMVPEMVKLALNNEEIVIYGDENSAGTYCYVSDVVRGLIQIMHSSEHGPLNLGSDWPVKFHEIAEKIIALSGSSSKISYAPKNDMMSAQWFPNISAVKERVGWLQNVLLDEGLKNTVNYLSAQKGIIEASEQAK